MYHSTQSRHGIFTFFRLHRSDNCVSYTCNSRKLVREEDRCLLQGGLLYGLWKAVKNIVRNSRYSDRYHNR